MPLLLALALLLAPPDYEADWAALLGEVVTADGLVQYDLLAGPLRDEFEAVAAQIEGFDAEALASDEDKIAFWMNAYNVKMVERVLAAGVPPNVEAHGFEFFFRTPVRVAGREVTLDEIEHVILRRQAGRAEVDALRVERLDPRLHVGLNCAAISCPRLRPFTAANVDAELDRAMRVFVNGTDHFRAEGDGFVLSSLLDWFGDDFGATGLPAGDYLLGFMDAERPDYERLRGLFGGRTAAGIAAQPGVRFEYRWDLNAAR